MPDQAHRVVIVGGGFGGLYAAQSLARAPVEVTLLDRRNFHLFQPLLYQVATGTLSPGDIAHPLRAILKRQRNVRILLAEVTGLDPQAKKVDLADGEVDFDTLIVAAGARNFYFGNDGWERHAPGLKSVEDATAMRRRILMAFEAAERETDGDARRALLTFVVVGGGPTGVELAGALGEIANQTLRNDFRAIDPSDATIVLLEGGERVLPPYEQALSAKAAASLAGLGVEVRTGTMVEAIDEDGVSVARAGGDGSSERIAARTVLWAAGIRPSPLAKVIAESTGAELDRSGRVIVGGDLSLPAYPEIFVIGDMAHCRGADGNPLPGVAPVAMQQGAYVAHCIGARLQNRIPAAFAYRDRGEMAVIGRSRAVADLRWARISGFPAWLIWLLIHLMYLVAFESRVVVLFRWAWNYLTWNRSARLITGDDLHDQAAAADEVDRAAGDS